MEWSRASLYICKTLAEEVNGEFMRCNAMLSTATPRRAPLPPCLPVAAPSPPFFLSFLLLLTSSGRASERQMKSLFIKYSKQLALPLTVHSLGRGQDSRFSRSVRFQPNRAQYKFICDLQTTLISAALFRSLDEGEGDAKGRPKCMSREGRDRPRVGTQKGSKFPVASFFASVESGERRASILVEISSKKACSYPKIN